MVAKRLQSVNSPVCFSTPFCYSKCVPRLPRLREIRERKMLTQRELAEKAKTSPTTIARLEAQTVDAQFRTIRKLAEALGVEPEELTRGDG
ncbi:MAG: helix-turn-helix domain-containing protein [Dehalococcoidia bacterium]|nr:helix-turn-helix domain-containing protein [Dehalococcoidia bacterium]